MLFIKLSKIDKVLINYLLEEDLDFLAYIMSPFHALGLDAYLFEISKTYHKKLKGVIVITPHSKDGIITTKKHIRAIKFADVKLFFISPFLKRGIFYSFKDAFIKLKALLNLNLQSTKNRNKSPLSIVSVMEVKPYLVKIFSSYRVLKKYNPKFVVIDEGGGTYLGNKIQKAIKEYDKNLRFKKLKRYNFTNPFQYIFTALDKKITSYLKNTFEIEKRFLLKEDVRGELLPNYPIIDAYKKVLDIYRNTPELNTQIKSIIITTQPFVEYHQIEISDYLRIIKELIRVLNRKYSILLKPHPREDIKKYDDIVKKEGIVLLPKEILLEEILSLGNIKLVIGAVTTTLLTSKLFYNIPSISIANVLLKYTKDPLLQVSILQFNEKFKNMIIFIDNFSLIDELI